MLVDEVDVRLVLQQLGVKMNICHKATKLLTESNHTKNELQSNLYFKKCANSSFFNCHPCWHLFSLDRLAEIVLPSKRKCHFSKVTRFKMKIKFLDGCQLSKIPNTMRTMSLFP